MVVVLTPLSVSEDRTMRDRPESAGSPPAGSSRARSPWRKAVSRRRGWALTDPSRATAPGWASSSDSATRRSENHTTTLPSLQGVKQNEVGR